MALCARPGCGETAVEDWKLANAAEGAVRVYCSRSCCAVDWKALDGPTGNAWQPVEAWTGWGLWHDVRGP